MDLLLILLRIIGIVSAILVIIFVHEMGHYLVGRWCGIKASVFSLGFGPELASFYDKHGTKWRLALLPLGGYVRFIDDESLTSLHVNNDANVLSGGFHQASAFRKALTIFAGPFFNAFFSFLIFYFLFFNNGQVILEPVLGEIIDGFPAKAQGLQQGDRILAINDENIDSFDEIMQKVMFASDERLKFTLDRGGKIFNIELVPRAVKRPTSFGKEVMMGTIGIRAPEDPNHPNVIDKKYVKTKHYSLWEACQKSYAQLYVIIEQTVKLLGRLIIGQDDRCQLSGPTETISMAWQVSAFGFWSLLNFVAILSIGIGLINLLPIPPLDGGQLFFYIWEAIFQRPVSEKIKEAIYKLGTLFVLAFMIFAILNDFIGC